MKIHISQKRNMTNEMLVCRYSVLEEMTGNLVKYLFYDQAMYD